MIDWIAQALLDSAGFIVSCFIARETPIRCNAGVARISSFGVSCGRGGALAYAVDHSAQQLHKKG